MVFFVFQMELRSKFHQVSTIGTIKIRDMEREKKYPIVRAGRFVTHMGHTILLTIQNPSRYCLRMLLPKRYARVVTDTDIENVNMNPGSFCLVYKGFDVLTRYILAIKEL